MNSSNNIIALASDHAGHEVKSKLQEYLATKGWKVINLGPHTSDSVDYPDYAKVLADRMREHPEVIGILACGSGIGMSIAANRYPHVRAALCHNVEYARLAREHNDANILVLGARFTEIKEIYDMVDAFLATPFLGGRHSTRVEKLGAR